MLQIMENLAGNLPRIAGGDLNNPENLLSGDGLTDAWNVCAQPRQGPIGSKVDRGTHQVKPGSTIDHILVGSGIKVHAFLTIDDQEDGLYPSDHLPVMATVEIDPHR